MNSNFFFVFFFNFCPRTDVKFHWPGEGGTGRVSDENSPSPSEPALGGGNGRLLQSSKLLLLVSPDSARLLLPSPTPDSHLGVLICCQQRNWKSKWTADGQRAFNRLARPSPWKCPSIDCSHRSLWQLQRPTHSTRWNHQLKNGIKVSGGRRRQSCSNAQLGNSTRLWLFIYLFFLVFFFCWGTQDPFSFCFAPKTYGDEFFCNNRQLNLLSLDGPSWFSSLFSNNHRIEWARPKNDKRITDPNDAPN